MSWVMSTYLLIASTSCVCMLRYMDTLWVDWTWLRASRKASTRRGRHRLAMCISRSSFAIPAYIVAYASKSCYAHKCTTNLEHIHTHTIQQKKPQQDYASDWIVSSDCTEAHNFDHHNCQHYSKYSSNLKLNILLLKHIKTKIYEHLQNSIGHYFKHSCLQ